MAAKMTHIMYLKPCGPNDNASQQKLVIFI